MGSLPGLEPQNTVMDCGLDVEALGVGAGGEGEVPVMSSRPPWRFGGKLRSGMSL